MSDSLAFGMEIKVILIQIYCPIIANKSLISFVSMRSLENPYTFVATAARHRNRQEKLFSKIVSKDAINLAPKIYSVQDYLKCFTEKLKRNDKLTKRGNRVAARDHYENRDVFELIKFLEYLLQISSETQNFVTRGTGGENKRSSTNHS